MEFSFYADDMFNIPYPKICLFFFYSYDSFWNLDLFFCLKNSPFYAEKPTTDLYFILKIIHVQQTKDSHSRIIVFLQMVDDVKNIFKNIIEWLMVQIESTWNHAKKKQPELLWNFSAQMHIMRSLFQTHETQGTLIRNWWCFILFWINQTKTVNNGQKCDVPTIIANNAIISRELRWSIHQRWRHVNNCKWI